MNDLIQTIAVYTLPVLFAITLHEAAHAFAAKYFGDSTAYLQGRMSLNPAKHIDPFGTILIPVLMFISTMYVPGGPYLLGYAKPVPVDFSKLRKPKRDMAWVALAGPAANFLMALLWLIFFIVLKSTGAQEPFFMKMAAAGVLIKLIILAFNLFPLPPLDGGRIMTSLLPHKYAYKFAQIEPYGFFIVLALVMIQALHFWDLWMVPIMGLAEFLLHVFVIPLNFLVN